MTTSVMPDILTNILDEEPIPSEKIAYLQARAKLRLHDLILRRFATAEDGPDQLDQSRIARRIGLSRARISQLLGVPGNWTIESATKLAAALGGEIDFTWIPFPIPQDRNAADSLAAHLATGQQRRESRLPSPSKKSRDKSILPL
jgi:plasmid maintenance system antidote protein VapI